MEAVKKAASGAVDTIRNSPLFRRKFGTQSRGEGEEDRDPRPLSPERDTTPFVQGINFLVREVTHTYTHTWLVCLSRVCRYPTSVVVWCPVS